MGFIRLGGNLETGEGGTTLAGAATMRGEPTVSDGECFMVENVARPLPPLDTRMDALPGDGEVLVANNLRCPTISFDVWVLGSSLRRRESLRRLSAMLAAKERTRLAFSDDAGLYYHVVRTGPLEPVEYIDSAMMHVQLKSLHPWMLGKTTQVDATTAGSTFTPGGNYPGALELRASSSITTDGDGRFGMLGLTFVELDASTSYSLNVFNTETRQFRVGTRYVAPELSNTWPTLAPGAAKTLRVEKGSGTVQLKYTDRWL